MGIQRKVKRANEQWMNKMRDNRSAGERSKVFSVYKKIKEAV